MGSLTSCADVKTAEASRGGRGVQGHRRQARARGARTARCGARKVHEERCNSELPGAALKGGEGEGAGGQWRARGTERLSTTGTRLRKVLPDLEAARGREEDDGELLHDMLARGARHVRALRRRGEDAEHSRDLEQAGPRVRPDHREDGDGLDGDDDRLAVGAPWVSHCVRGREGVADAAQGTCTCRAGSLARWYSLESTYPSASM